MTLYLNENVTSSTIAEASAVGIVGVKVYPAYVPEGRLKRAIKLYLSSDTE